MKFKSTRKAIRAGYPIILRVGYCDAQHLLQYHSPRAYCTRVEGWACDVYEVAPGVALCTGYAPFGNVVPGYDLTREYDERARQLIYAGGENLRAALDVLLAEYVAEARRRG